MIWNKSNGHPALEGPVFIVDRLNPKDQLMITAYQALGRHQHILPV